MGPITMFGYSDFSALCSWHTINFFFTRLKKDAEFTQSQQLVIGGFVVSVLGRLGLSKLLAKQHNTENEISTCILYIAIHL